jgi:hypothetical protein
MNEQIGIILAESNVKMSNFFLVPIKTIGWFFSSESQYKANEMALIFHDIR